MRAVIIEAVARIFAHVIVLPPLVLIALLVRLRRYVVKPSSTLPRLIWAGVPVLSLASASRAMRLAGYDSISIASARYHTMHEHDFDQFVPPVRVYPWGFNSLIKLVRGAWLFATALIQRDVLHGLFNGAILGTTALVNWEYRLWKLGGGALVLMPYGSDAFIYSALPDTAWARALRQVYPRSDRTDRLTAWRVAVFTKQADTVVGCIVHDVCLPQVDVLPVLWYPAPLQLTPKAPAPEVDGPIRIVHPSNHRAIKGTNALVAAVAILRVEGFDIDLDVIEKTPHDVALERLATADIVVDQLLFGYGLTALEGMALAKPVISGVSDHPIYDAVRQSSYLREAPIVSAAPHTILDVLRELLNERSSLGALGRAHRDYAERYHSDDATVDLFEKIYLGHGLISAPAHPASS